MGSRRAPRRVAGNSRPTHPAPAPSQETSAGCPLGSSNADLWYHPKRNEPKRAHSWSPRPRAARSATDRCRPNRGRGGRAEPRRGEPRRTPRRRDPRVRDGPGIRYRCWRNAASTVSCAARYRPTRPPRSATRSASLWHAYEPQPLRAPVEIHADILALEKETEGLLPEIVGNG